MQKRFIVGDLGSTPVGRDNAAFMFCKDLPVIDALAIGGTISVVFQSGRGSNRSTITRVEDGPAIAPIGGKKYCSVCGSLVCGHERS